MSNTQKRILSNSDKELLIESLEGAWEIEREEDGLAVLCSEISECYLVVDRLMDLYEENEIVLAPKKLDELYDAIDNGYNPMLTIDEAETEFNGQLNSFQALTADEVEKAYRAYLQDVKNGIGAEWQDVALSKEDFLKDYKVELAQKKIDNFVNNKLYEKNTPYNLRSREQFVVWKYELVQDADGNPTDRITKVPYSPKNGNKTSSTTRWGWADFDTACKAVDKYNAHGVGIMFANGLVGIDIDHCIVNGELSDNAKDIVKSVNSYTEYSPSGTGLHILCFGKKPGDACRKNEIEMYSKNRFFTLTGEPYKGIFKKIPKAEVTQSGITEVYNKYLKRPESNFKKINYSVTDVPAIPDSVILKKCLSSKSGEFFDKMYNLGICDKHFLDDGKVDLSAHDLELCSMLAYYTPDMAQIDRLFRNSRLMREKWDLSRGSLTYGERTISMALASREKNAYNPSYGKDKGMESWWQEHSNNAQFSDEEVIKKCLASKSGDRFEKLFVKGDMTIYPPKLDGKPNQSRCDFALLGFLSNITQDAAQIDRIYQQSKIARSNWNERVGSTMTNGQKLIMRVMTSQFKRCEESKASKKNVNVMG